MFQPSAVLVTGAAGFIGSHFVDLCLQQSNISCVVSLDALTYAGDQKNLLQASQDPRHHFVHANINDKARILDVLQHFKIDTIVHFAAESHVDRSISAPEDFVMTNVVGAFRLLEAAREFWSTQFKELAGHCRFHHISTDEVYGALTKDAPAFCESTPYAPNSPYSASKASSDHFVRSYFHTYGLPVIMTNCSNNYGPRQCSEKLIPVIIDAALQGKEIPIYGDGSHIRDWLYVNDHCEAVWLALTQGALGCCYNIGGDCEMDNVALAHRICQELDALMPRKDGTAYSDLITFVTDRPGHDQRYAVNHQSLTLLTGWQPRTSFEKGLAETIKFYVALLEVPNAVYS